MKFLKDLPFYNPDRFLNGYNKDPAITNMFGPAGFHNCADEGVNLSVINNDINLDPGQEVE